MKAIVQNKYGSFDEVLELKEIDKPVIGDDEVLVRVCATAVHADVWHVVTGLPYAMRLFGSGLRKPKHRVPGTDVAGVIESVGRNVTDLQEGDEVFGESHGGMQWKNGGAFAEYVAVPAEILALKPEGVTFEQAAAIPTSGYIALHNVQLIGKLEAGQHLLINGAGGGVGTLSLQIAKALGAKVTVVDCAEKLEMLRSLGADHAIDYQQEDFTKGDVRYDLIVDVASTLDLADCKRVLTPGGKYIIIGHDHYGTAGRLWFGNLPHFFKLALMSKFVKDLPDPNFNVPSKKEIISTLRELLEAGKITPVIDRTFGLAEVPEAMQYLVDGHAKGKIVISMEGKSSAQSEEATP